MGGAAAGTPPARVAMADTRRHSAGVAASAATRAGGGTPSAPIEGNTGRGVGEGKGGQAEGGTGRKKASAGGGGGREDGEGGGATVTVSVGEGW